MTLQSRPSLIWVVVKVESGIPTLVKAYQDRQSAVIREHLLRNSIHPENDETGIFEVQTVSSFTLAPTE